MALERKPDDTPVKLIDVIYNYVNEAKAGEKKSIPLSTQDRFQAHSAFMNQLIHAAEIMTAKDKDDIRRYAASIEQRIKTKDPTLSAEHYIVLGTLYTQDLAVTVDKYQRALEYFKEAKLPES